MSLSPATPDWMVLQCPACSRRMKVQRHIAQESRLLCPHCQSLVPHEEEAPPAIAAPPAAGGAAASPHFSPSPLPPRPTPDRGAFPLRESVVMQAHLLPTGTPAPPPPSPPREDSHLPSASRSAHPEFQGNLPAANDADPDDQDEDETHDGVPPSERRRAKVKKRRSKRSSTPRYLELADWDQTDLKELPEAEIAADIWEDARPLPEDVLPQDEENDYVVETVDDGEGQTRTTKKRVRRRRLLLGARLFFLRLTSLSRHATAGLALLVAGIAVYGVYVFRQKYQAPVLPPDPDLIIDRSVLTRSDELAAEQVIRDFLAADGIEAKLAFVRQPNRVRRLMEKWYRGERTAGPLQAGEPTLRGKKGGEPGSVGYYVLMALPVFVPDPINPGSTYEEMTFFAVEEIRNGPDSTYLVDWETSTGYQELPLETFKATMPPNPYPFRIFMKAEEYYNHGFSELEWQSVTLYYPGRNFQLYGYINRTTLEGRAMLPLVENGNSAGIIAELAYPPDAVSREQVIVKRMLHPSWFYATEKEAAAWADFAEPSSPN